MTPAETWVALVHHPVYDRNRKVVATALTNLDLHDIARSSRTYGLQGFFIVHPVAAQRELAERIARHWLEGEVEHEPRRQAIERISIVESLDAAVAAIRARAAASPGTSFALESAETRAHPSAQGGLGAEPRLIATSARPAPGTLSAAAARALPGPALVVLGTGWGLTDEAVDRCSARLAPIQGAGDYNHLSVRSACAIILDRLYGDRED